MTAMHPSNHMCYHRTRFRILCNVLPRSLQLECYIIGTQAATTATLHFKIPEHKLQHVIGVFKLFILALIDYVNCSKCLQV